MDENGFPKKIHQSTIYPQPEMVRIDDLQDIIRDVLYRDLGVPMTPATANGAIMEILRRARLKGQDE